LFKPFYAAQQIQDDADACPIHSQLIPQSQNAPNPEDRGNLKQRLW
jgi:hypothetical protein